MAFYLFPLFIFMSYNMKTLCYLLNKLLNAVTLETLHLLTSLQLSCNTVVYKELIGSQLTKEHSHPRAWIQICKHHTFAFSGFMQRKS